MSNDGSGMRGNRSRDEGGQLSRTRGDKHVGTLEEQYGRDFGVRAEMNVETLLQNAGVQSVKQLLDSKLGRKGDGK